MANAARILQRIRSLGANVVVQGESLTVVNKAKLPANALGYIQANAQEIASFLAGENDAVDERSAIIEFDGRTPREWADQFADILIRRRPAGVTDEDWNAFIMRCGEIIDAAPMHGEA